MKRYQPTEIEPKWQHIWADTNLYRAMNNDPRQKYYYMVEFPYPSGEGLHVGHVLSYTALDIMARHKRMQGFNVLYPMGFDAFGLPTENYAIKHKVAPQAATTKNIANYVRQLKSIGLSFDWDRMVTTTDPDYYRWTQWIFLQLLKAGLAYQAEMPINWCPFEKTGLANEEVVNGVHERCGTPVEKKLLKQWMLKITAYADRLIDDLATVDYPDRIASQQVNWIGRSEGAEITFNLDQRLDGTDVVFLHAFKDNSTSVFWPNLKAELEQRGAKIYAPDLPNSSRPNVDEQVDFVLKHHTFKPNTVIVAHSLGSHVAMKLIEKLDGPVGRLIMAGAPLRTDDFKDGDRRPDLEAASDWKFDYGSIRQKVRHIEVLISSNDHIVPASHGEELAKHLGVEAEEYVTTEPHFNGTVEPSIFAKLLPHVTVYTTRPDTLFGATFLVVSPELADSWIKAGWQAPGEAASYIQKALNESELARQEDKTKTGVDTGIKAVHPLSGDEVPVWVADYVLGGYGTGAIMAVPAHDQRDHDFAQAFGLPERIVVEPVTGTPQESPEKRRSIVAIVRDKDGKLLSINWGPKAGGHLFVGGGRDDKEDAEACARREILEETGYQNLTLRGVSETVHHHYFAHTKNVARDIEAVGLFFELDNDERSETALEADEAGKFTVEWLTAEQAERAVTDGLHSYLFRKFVRGEVYTGKGPLTNSDDFNGLSGGEAAGAIIKALVAQGAGHGSKKYKLRDWIFSRQHYWGEPIPVIHCPHCGVVPVPEDQLPVTLPEVESYEPTQTGESPLAAITDWVNVPCPTCGKSARRETDTMPNWAGSSWYYLRYTDPHNDQAFAGRDNLDYWTPVDLYNGGMEHTTLHLLYSRFWHKFLFDQGLVPTAEPYARRRSHGMILGPDGVKMSKSRGNVINPDAVVGRYGADSIRLYEMFMGPFEEQKVWSDEHLSGVSRFLYRVWTVVGAMLENTGDGTAPDGVFATEVDRFTHKTLKKVHEDIEALSFNTMVSALMEYVNFLQKNLPALTLPRNAELAARTCRYLILMLAPSVPHMTEELWRMLGEEGSVHSAAWPLYDPKLIRDDVVHVAVQVNGKLRGTIMAAADATDDDLAAAAKSEPNVAKYIAEGNVLKTIVVPRKLVNFVVK